MVVIEITKVILSRGDEWALVQYRSKNGSGTFGGVFGCHTDALVAGQYFKGTITSKRDRSGNMKKAFKGLPVSRIENSLKHALKVNGINWTDRATLFSSIKPLNRLISILKNRNCMSELMALPKIGRKKLFRIYSAYESVAETLNHSMEMGKTLPSLSTYLNDNQRSLILKLYLSMENFVKAVVHDPWRILYDKEYDSFTYQNASRQEFLSGTKPKSRRTMVVKAMADLNLKPDDPRAQRAHAIHKIREYMKRTGNYWMPLSQFAVEIQPSWPCSIRDGHVALVRYAEIEQFIEKTLSSVRAEHNTFTFRTLGDHSLDETQLNAVTTAWSEPVFILNGGAGTGKTTVCSHIVRCLGDRVLCAAPTGKAAQRLSQVTGQEAFTVHRLAYMSELHESKDVLLLDEQSMQEPEILAMYLKKRTFKKIIFVGDTAQLTSVGPGQFFKDLCASDYARVELKKIYRSSDTSFVATNGEKIRNGNTQLEYSEDSFVVHPYKTDQAIIKTAAQIYKTTNEMPMVLCNTNAEVAALNGPLREICNPLGNKTVSDPVNMDYVSSSFRYSNWRFGVGDSVINIVNRYKEASNGTELEVANGEIGTVRSINGPKIIVSFDTVVEYDIRESDFSIRPAYALTVNKSQGSEYPIVIVKSTTSWGDKRERLYTAVTRAKKKCIIFEVGTANSDCIRAAPAIRKTFLFKK